jgi:hypothetical protein
VAETGKPDRAETIARSINVRSQKEQALAVVARAVAETGNHDRAEMIAHSITNSHQQAQVLSTLAMTVQPDRARRLVAYALMVGDWRTCLESLVQLQPRAISVVADELCERQTSPT